MPGKFPKVFQKRKSSGDVLEDVSFNNSNRPVSSFRVLERPQQPDTLNDRPAVGLRRKTNEPRPKSEGNVIDAMAAARPGPNPLNRGSGGTQKSNSSYGAYDDSSGRYSSTSTLPSSIDGPDEYGGAALRHAKTMSPNLYGSETGGGSSGGGASSFLRSAGRKFSFGGKKSMQAAEALRQDIAATTALPPRPQPLSTAYSQDRPLYAGVHDIQSSHDLPSLPPTSRARAPTETSYASESTVTLGKTTIDKLELASANGDDDGFGDLFAGIGEEKRKSRTLDAALATNLGRPLTENKSYAPYRPITSAPPPLQLDSNPRTIFSPNIDSATSADGLIVASPVDERDVFSSLDINSSRDGKMKQPQSPTSPTRQNRPRRHSKANSRTLLPRSDSAGFEDTDALLVRKSVSPKNSPAPATYRDNPSVTVSRPPISDRSRSLKTTDADANPWAEERPPPVPSHGKAAESRQPLSPDDNGVDESLLNDATFQALAISADRVQGRAPSPPRSKPVSKVMTPAQFELYRKEQAQRRKAGDVSDSESDKSDGEEEEEEEDEIERHRKLTKQRQRQEAQLSVYRQSMMKITGEKPMGPAASTSNLLRPSMDRGQSRLSSKLSIGSLRERANESALTEDDDEDDEVPLGILAAHGFPNKELGRPPNHVRTASNGIQYSSETYPPPPAPQSVIGGPSGGPVGGGSLPAFARRLPQDPFYGASLVNQADRQSFALGGGAPASIYGGSNHSQTNLPPPPGGLVGVIASEERARAIRRGGPVKTFGYGNQDPNGSMPLPLQMQAPVAPQMPMPMPMPMPQAPAPPMIVGPEQQANIQMAQQMTQMMQMQMQWMQQMMAMQTGGGGQQGGANNMQQMQQMQAMMQQMQGMSGMPGQPQLQQQQQQQQQGFLQPGQAGMGNGRASTMMHPPNFNPGLAVNGNPAGGRAMSMMGGRVPSMMFGGSNGVGGGPGPTYTPSIAPSERSTVGQPSRYRPVSTMPGGEEEHVRSNSFGAQSSLGGFGLAPGNAQRSSTMGGRISSGGGLSAGGSRSGNMINVRLVETRGSSGRDEDEEDEAGWEEMRRKKESKRGKWRTKKSGSGAPGKENVSPAPSEVSSRGGGGGGARSRSPKKASTMTAPVPPAHGDESGLEGVFIPDLDRL